jgi:DNA-binding PucR family transcriptional regulator
MGSVQAVLTNVVPAALPTSTVRGLRIGVGPALPGAEAAYSWEQALVALRFASSVGPGSSVVHAEQLGALAVIAQRLRTEDIAQVADVAVLDCLAAEPEGAETLTILDALCRTGSARKAATAVHRHHSTLIARIAGAESVLGFSVSTPPGRTRLELALMLRQLRDNPY